MLKTAAGTRALAASKARTIMALLGATINCIPVKRIPHPSSPTDASSFEPLPFDGDLDKLVFVLNRMLPPDVRVNNVSPTPSKTPGERPFHPTLDAVEKTYRYTFSVGHVHHPMRWRHVWHVSDAPTSAHGGKIKKRKRKRRFDAGRARECAGLFVGSHDFAAFRGAFRGGDRKNRFQYDTVCNLSSVIIEREEEEDETVDRVGVPSPLHNVAVGGHPDEAAARGGLEPLFSEESLSRVASSMEVNSNRLTSLDTLHEPWLQP